MKTDTFSIRMEAELLARIRELAENDRRVVNQEILFLLEKGLEEYEKEQEILSRNKSESKQTVKNVG